MAQSTQRAVSDGTLVTLDLSINYLDRSEISVYFDAVLTTAWAWVGETAKQITFSPAVPNGVEVLVKRTTDISKLRHEFSKGAAFTAEVLDEDLTQVLHIAQEASESNLSGQFYSDIDMHNYRIRNIGTAVDDTDALSLGQYKADANGAFASKTAAAASAAAAASSAEASAASATSAGNSAAAAATSATNAANASRLTTGTVTTGAAGSSASETITGAAGSQVLNLTIPRGDTGPQGPQGPQGSQGPQGPQGPTGPGSGDVLGPGAAVTADALAQWSGTTGTNIKAVTFSGLVKLASGVPSAAVAGTDYVEPTGSITGNAATATKLKTARTLTIGNTGKSVDGSADVSWSLAEIGVTAATETASGIVELATAAEAQAGTDSTRAVTPSGIAAYAGALSFRNKLINAAFTVNQRGFASVGTATSANQYTLDRWRVVTSGQSLSWSGTAPRMITAPEGGVEQVIEGIWIEGGTYTLSWSGTTTATVNGSAVARGGQVTLAAGENATVRFRGGTVSEPQLERGSYATQFEHRPYGLELMLCQRYYEVGGYRAWGAAAVYVGTSVLFAATKRSNPTIVLSDVGVVGLSNLRVEAPYLNKFDVIADGAVGTNYYLQITFAANAEL